MRLRAGLGTAAALSALAACNAILGIGDPTFGPSDGGGDGTMGWDGSDAGQADGAETEASAALDASDASVDVSSDGEGLVDSQADVQADSAAGRPDGSVDGPSGSEGSTDASAPDAQGDARGGAVCDANVASDPMNCGSCGHTCSTDAGAAVCSAGVCSFSTPALTAALWMANVGGPIALWSDGTIQTDGYQIDATNGTVTGVAAGKGDTRPQSIWIDTSGSIVEKTYSDGQGLTAYNRNGTFYATFSSTWGCCDYIGDPLIIDPVGGQGYHVADYIAYHFDLTMPSGARLADVPSVPFPSHFVLRSATSGYSTTYTGASSVAYYTFSATAGVRAWNIAVPSTPSSATPRLNGPAVAADGSAVVSSPDGLLANITPSSTISWHRTDVAALTWAVIGGQGQVVLGVTTTLADGGTAYTIDAYAGSDGSRLWSTDVGSAAVDVLVGDGGIVWALLPNDIVGLDIASGHLVARYTNIPSGSYQMVLRGGVLYVMAGVAFALPVASRSYDPASPWPVKWHDNQRTSNASATLAY